MIRLLLQFLLTSAECCLLMSTCYAQADTQDIEAKYREAIALPDDTAKVRRLNKLTYQFIEALDFDRAFRCSGQALTLASQLEDLKGVAMEHYAIGMIHTRQYDFPKAIASFQDALMVATKTGNKRLASNAHLCIGNSNFSMERYDEAIAAHNQALSIKLELRDTPLIIMSYNNIGIVHWNAGNYPSAYKYYGLGLAVGKASHDSSNVANSYNTLGLVYDNEGNYPEALSHFLMASEVSTAQRDTLHLIAICNNIGNLYRKQEKYDQALEYFARAISWNDNILDSRELGNSHNYTGIVYTLMRKFPEARKHIEQAITLFNDIQFKFGLAEAHSNMSAVVFKEALQEKQPRAKEKLLTEASHHATKGLGEYRAIAQNEGEAECLLRLGSICMERGESGKARTYLSTGLAIAKGAGVKEKIRDGHLAMGKLDSMTGNWEQAFHHQRMFAIYRDSMLNEDISRKVLALQMQHDFDHRSDSMQYQLKSLQQDGEIQALRLKREWWVRNILIAGFSVIGVCAFLLYNNYVVRQRLKMQTLRNKIASDLHDDVGSTLSSIAIFSEMAQQQSKETIPLLNTIQDSSREMLDAMADIVWTINPENDQFEKIIMRMRNFAFELLGAKQIEFQFTAGEDIAQLKLPMDVRKNLYLIFKEATNNLVKYSGATRAQYAIVNEGSRISMTIRDNGKGFDMVTTQLGNGLKSMKKRAEEIGGMLNIESQPGKGTFINLQLAL